MKTIKNKNKANRKNKSFKGKRGNLVGAPPKATRFPNSPFTMAGAFKANGNQCQLSVRKKVDVLLAAGELIQLKSRKQAKGGVGRPKAVFVKAAHFNVTKHERLHPVTNCRRTAVNTAISTTAPVDVLVPAAPAPVAPAAPAAPAPVELVAATETLTPALVPEPALV